MLFRSDSPNLIAGGRIDLSALSGLAEPLGNASTGFEAAARQVAGIDTGELSGPIGSPLARAVERVRTAARVVDDGHLAAQVLPTMLGGTKHYLVVFDNNAEIRTTGGLPGAWALITATDGSLSLTSQGSFGPSLYSPTPVLPLSRAERALFTDLPATDFRDTAFVPDAQRVARLQAALWERGPGRSQPGGPVRLDGVLHLDTVGLSYLMGGTGPVTVENFQLTSDNAVDQLLSRSYALLGARSDEIFRAATAAVFRKLTTSPDSPVDLVSGFTRAFAEDRFHAVGTTPRVARLLKRAGGDGDLDPTAKGAPAAYVTLDDGTAAKMSYYLRRSTTAEVSCVDGRPALTGYTRLDQTIAKATGAKLDPYVTGAGLAGLKPGTQQVVVRVYGPPGSGLAEVDLNGRDVTREVTRTTYLGRPAVVVPTLVDGATPVLVAWRFTGGDLPTRPQVWQTPSVVPGGGLVTSTGSCRR